METSPDHHHAGNHGQLINTLLQCAQACEKCMTASFKEKDILAMARCIELARDCSEICFVGTKLLIREAEVSHKYLVICEEACRVCAEECGKHQSEHCKQCAEACQICAEACHKHHGQQIMK